MTKYIYIDNINKVIDTISSWKVKKDFTNGMLEFSKILGKVNEQELSQNEEFLNCCFKNFEQIFSNECFLKNLEECIELKESENFESLVILRLAIEASLFPLSFCVKTIDLHSVNLIKDTIKNMVSKLNNNIEKKLQSYDLFYFFDSLVSDKKYSCKSSGYIRNFNKFLTSRIITDNIIKLISINLSSSKLLEDEFKNIVSNHKKMEHFSLWTALSIIYAQIEKRRLKIDGILNSKYGDITSFFNHFEDKNISMAFFVIGAFLKGFRLSGKVGELREESEQNIKDFIKVSSEIKNNIYDYSKINFKAYQGQACNKSVEWSNKIFLITNKTLSTFEVLIEAEDWQWVCNVFVFEMYRWIEDVHMVLNKYELEDEWIQIKDYLYEENNTIEWKSTFLTPTETLFKGDEVEKKMGVILLNLVSRAILGMVNTEGGVILVGIIENPEKVKREDIKRMSIKKNGVTFFNINYEFKKKNINNTDLIKRKIQDCLSAETKCGVEIFNNLWTIKPIEIKSNYESVFIYKIEVKIAPKLIFSVKDSWITLIKRADGRTVEVNPKKLIDLTLYEK